MFRPRNPPGEIPNSEMSTRETVVLVHGVLLSGWSMRLIARRLRRRGYQTAIFSYPSRHRGLDENARALAHFIDGLNADTLHLVGHSLGGLVILRALENANDFPDGRVVLLGSPVKGSVIAKRLGRYAMGRWLLGKSLESALLGGIEPQVERPTGLIVGQRPFGIGLLLGGFPGSHDGTVMVGETVMEKAADTLCVQETHTSLLFSAAVAQWIAEFLKNGRFETRGAE